jgi:hypothetical protein
MTGGMILTVYNDNLVFSALYVSGKGSDVMRHCKQMC